jgi:hypothetical protein
MTKERYHRKYADMVVCSDACDRIYYLLYHSPSPRGGEILDDIDHVRYLSGLVDGAVLAKTTLEEDGGNLDRLDAVIDALRTAHSLALFDSLPPFVGEKNSDHLLQLAKM